MALGTFLHVTILRMVLAFYNTTVMAWNFRKFRVVYPPSRLIPILNTIKPLALERKKRLTLGVNDIHWIIFVHFITIVDYEISPKIHHQTSFNGPIFLRNFGVDLVFQVLVVKEMNEFK